MPCRAADKELNMKKKLICTLLVLAQILMIAGCSNKKEETVNESPYDKRINLVIWETQGTDYVPQTVIKDNVVENWLVSKTNVKVKNVYGNDGGQWDTKLTKLAAGNNLPNLINCGAGQGPAHFQKLKEMGALAELTPELLKECAPDIWNSVSEEQWKKLTASDGTILGIPYDYSTMSRIDGKIKTDETQEDLDFQLDTIKLTDDMTVGGNGTFYIRDDILKKIYPEAKSYDELVKLLNEKNEPIGDELLDVPIYSTQDYIDFMYKIKELNLKEDGKTVYTFGYNGGDNWVALTYLGADMYGYKGRNYCSWWNTALNKMEIPLAHDVVKQAAKTQSQMIRDKVIDPESLTHNDATYKEKILNGRYAIIPADYVGININKELESRGVKYRYRPLITQVPAQKGLEVIKTQSGDWGQAICLLNTLSKDEVKQVLNWMNVQYTDEYEEVKNWGPKEAGLYTETKDGKREFKDERFRKYFVDNDTSALNVQETKGVNGPMQAGYRVGLYSIWSGSRHWTPEVMERKNELLPAMNSGFKFKSDSVHVTNVKTLPFTDYIWDAAYADIPEVVKYWGAREQWENKFKLAFASDSDAEFETKWKSAVDLLNSLVDVDKMEEKMTEAALAQENQ